MFMIFAPAQRCDRRHRLRCNRVFALPPWRLEYAMTWSIVARDRSGAFGVAIASKFFAVGVLCPHVRSGVGAFSTQALVNPLYGARALDLMAQGKAPAEVVSLLTGADEGRDHRQLHMIDAQDRIAAHTGSAC